MRFKYIAIMGVSLIAILIGLGSLLQEDENVSASLQASQSYPRQVIPDVSTVDTLSCNESIKKALELPAPIKSNPELVLVRSGYVVSYNPSTCCPNYVAWHLTSERVNGTVPRYKKFIADDDVQKEYRAYPEDYRDSGYDRGHMCPAGDNKDSREHMMESFLLTNVCPQNQYLNSGDWNEIEQTCRRWANELGDLYIVCGPVYDNIPYNTIGQNVQIAVPDRFFKVVLCMMPTPQCIGFICPNQKTERPLSEYCVSVDEVERITGMDFFPSIEDKVENIIEAECKPYKWGL